MRLPEEQRKPLKDSSQAPISYIAYCGLGWLFVFGVYTCLIALGFLFIPAFIFHSQGLVRAIAFWEVLGVWSQYRWQLPLGPSGGFYMLYELIFPWKYAIPDKKKKSN